MSVIVAELTEAELADRWGALKRRANLLAVDIDTVKCEFERRELLSAKGLKFTVARSKKYFNALDVKAIRAEMGEAWCEKRERPGERTTYEVNPVPKG